MPTILEPTDLSIELAADAMRAGKASSGDYLADWTRSEPRRCGDDIQAEAEAEAQRIEARYTDADLLRLIRAHGLEAPLPEATPVPDIAPGDA